LTRIAKRIDLAEKARAAAAPIRLITRQPEILAWGPPDAARGPKRGDGLCPDGPGRAMGRVMRSGGRDERAGEDEADGEDGGARGSLLRTTADPAGPLPFAYNVS